VFAGVFADMSARDVAKAANGLAALQLACVFGVADLLEPLRHRVDVQCEVGHRSLWCCSVPVAFTRLDPDRTAGRDLLNRFACLLDAAAPLDDEQQLHPSMRVPGSPR